MERPFALLGNHPSSDARVGGSRGPALAYVVCAFPEAVEVWPLAAVAFPRWGVIQSHHELLVGSQRITVEHPATMPGGPAPPDLPELAISTMLVWDRQPRAKVFRRRVTIIGESHPSVMRLHDRGLRACDHAAVVYKRTLWMLDLNPDRWENSRQPPVVKLDTSGDSTQVGGVTIRFNAAVAQQSLPPELARLSRAASASGAVSASDSVSAPGAGTKRRWQLDQSGTPEKPSPSDRDEAAGQPPFPGVFTGSHRPDQTRPGDSPDAEIDSGSDADLLGALQFDTTADERSSRPADRNTAEDAGSRPDADVAPATGTLSDQLTARVTRRLVSINQHRFLRRRAPWVLASAIVFAIAVWLIVRLGRTLFQIWFGGSGTG